MDFDLDDAQRKRYREIFDGARERFDAGPCATPDAQFSRGQWRAAAKLGLTGLCLPREYGGGGLGALDTALCLEAFTAGGADTGLAFALAAHLLACAVPIRDFGTGGTRAELLAGLAAGSLIAGNAMTEDEAGSDVGRLATVARRDGDHYVLDGAKSFVSNAPVADVFVTYAATDRTAGYLGISAFVVRRERLGVSVGVPLPKMGLHGCPAARVAFESCRVPVVDRLGGEGMGGVLFQHSMDWERACLFAIYIGLMCRQLDRVVAHAKRRRQFGRSIGEFQAVSHRVATMRQRLESARLLLYRACWLVDGERDERVAAAALSKVAVSEAAVANSLDAVQVFGALGYLGSHGIEQQLRDAVPATIFSGTTEMQREIIARELFQ